MNKEDLESLKKELSSLSEEELRERDLYLRGLAAGELEGPPVGYPSIDKPWLRYYSKESINDLDLSCESVYNSLRNASKDNLDKVAISYFGKKYTYKQMKDIIDVVANAFLEYGVNPGDVVTLSLPNIPENVFCFYALNKIGAVANFVDLRLKGEKLVDAINKVDSKMIITNDIFIDNLERVVDRTVLDKVVVASVSESLPVLIKGLYKLKNSKVKFNDNFIKWGDFLKAGKNSSLISSYSPSVDDASCILHTSGTTGTPKGVVLTNKNFIAMANQVKNSGLKYNENDTFLSQVPPFLAYNILAATNNPLSMGLEVIMLPDYQPTKFAQNIIKYKPNHVIAGPADWDSFVDYDVSGNKDFSFLVSMISGSDKISEEKKSQINSIMHSLGCEEEILEGYGLTEVGAAAIMNLPQRNIPNSVGVPLRHVNVGIFNNDEDKELGYNEVGEICLSGPTVMKEYFGNPSETRNVKVSHNDGTVWLHTGDLGTVDNDGNVYLKGRIKRVIIRHDGIKVSPYDLEKVITAIPDVSDCCVVGVDDLEHGHGSVPIAAVVVSEDSLLDDRELTEVLNLECQLELGEKYQPKGFVVLPELPLTDVGKVDYKEVQRIVSNKDSVKILKKNS